MSRRGQEFVKDLAERASAHTGLNYGYFGGRVRSDNVITLVSPGTVLLAANSTNYIEAGIDGNVSANTTSFTSGKVPMAVVVTGESSFLSTNVAEKRTMVSTGGGSTNVFADPAYWMGV